MAAVNKEFKIVENIKKTIKIEVPDLGTVSELREQYKNLKYSKSINLEI